MGLSHNPLPFCVAAEKSIAKGEGKDTALRFCREAINVIAEAGGFGAATFNIGISSG